MLEHLHEAHADDEPFNGTVADELTARSLLIEYQRNERKVGKLSETAAAVHREYAHRIERLEERQEAIREMLQRFVADHGKVSFPDVGGASLVNRKPAPKVTDPDALLAWARQHAPELVRITETVPAADAKEYVKTTGELPAGVELDTPEPGLTIRRAAA